MTPAEVATALALYSVPPLAVAIVNPAARAHMGAIGAGIFGGGLVGRIAAGFLPAEEQTGTNEAVAAIVGSAIGGVAMYFVATRGERQEVARAAVKTKRKRRR